jgi:hypothetical protein
MTQPIKNPFPTPIRSLRIQKNRRVLTVLSQSFLLSAIVLALMNQSIPAFIVILFSMVFSVILHFATRNIANAMNIITDERERSLRDHAHRIAYWVMSGVLGGIFGLVAGIGVTQEANTVLLKFGDFTRLDVVVYLLAFWTFFLGLPTAIIAWLEPDAFEE